MHIRRLELHGFKSFKDKTLINFDDGITGIVGPNGCGKSNVVDAFFWVMGEQNARHLRGQSMDDLIFAGADNAPPASYAEVTLTLEMPAELTGPNAPAGASSKDLGIVQTPTRDVAITRKLYRTGESDYFINKVPCRLRDIQELFMDTGVGARGYSIIQQGQIAKIVQAKPEDRRTMIEEVAGIVKYKARRKESMRKLEGTQQNLLRVTDVITELETQKRTMERQADKARKSKEWKDRLQDIELRFNAMKFEDLTNRLMVVEQEMEALSVEDISLTTERETMETQISQKRMEAAQAGKISEEFQARWIEIGNNLNNKENELKYSQKTLEDNKATFSQLETDSQEEKTLVEALASQHDEILQEGETIESQCAEASETRLAKENEANLRKKEMELNEKKADEQKRLSYSVGNEAERLENDIRFAELRLNELASSLARIENDKTEHESREISVREEKEENAIELHALRDKAKELQEEIFRLASEIDGKNRQLQEERKVLSELTSEEAKAQTTLRTLEDQKKRHEDSSNGVKTVFQKLLPENAALKEKVLGTLADSIQVEKGKERAVEAALGKALEIVLTSDATTHSKLTALLDGQKGGRAAFADLEKAKSTSIQAALSAQVASVKGKSGVLGVLSQFVSPEKSARSEVKALLELFLGDHVLVDSLATAETLGAEFPSLVFLTAEGAIVRGGWFLEGGDASGAAGSYVSRNREISELTEQVAALSKKIADQKDSLATTEIEVGECIASKKEKEDALKQLQPELHRLSSREASFEARINESKRSLDKFLQEETRLHAEKERITQEREEKIQDVAAAKLKAEEASLQSDQLTSNLVEAKALWETAQQEYMNARVKEANVIDQKNSLQTRLRQSQVALDQHKNRIDTLLEQTKKKVEESKMLDELVVILATEIESMRINLVAAEQEYRIARDKLDEMNHEIEELRSSSSEAGTRERTIKDKLMKFSLEQQRLNTDRDLMAQNTYERYALTLAEYCMLPETMEQVQLLRDSGEAIISDIQNEVSLLRQKLQKLGDVNPAAVEEYDAIVERYNLLASQKADLEKAMADLQSTVDKINKVSKERFERAFGEVNTHFKRVFPIIFGGGHAQLTLTNPEDMLETGVDITAQPPGKKPQNINLLSGGEKTLTAISLLFAIFLVKPSPFCLLDEVDAPLDDANIGRFNALLREMAKRSQFIIITHNKRTMELNDKLYGVTMEDAGISKMVSVQLSATA